VLSALLLARMAQVLASQPAFVISIALVAEAVPFPARWMVSTMVSTMALAMMSAMAFMVLAQVFVMWGAVSA
jgi:hypothetical protein